MMQSGVSALWLKEKNMTNWKSKKKRQERNVKKSQEEGRGGQKQREKSKGREAKRRQRKPRRRKKPRGRGSRKQKKRPERKQRPSHKVWQLWRLYWLWHQRQYQRRRHVVQHGLRGPKIGRQSTCHHRQQLDMNNILENDELILRLNMTLLDNGDHVNEEFDVDSF